MTKSTWVYRRLRDFRAGIEGCISFLKRCFGLDRCSWRSFASFKAYVQASVLSFNLLVLARHLIPASAECRPSTSKGGTTPLLQPKALTCPLNRGNSTGGDNLKCVTLQKPEFTAAASGPCCRWPVHPRLRGSASRVRLEQAGGHLAPTTRQTMCQNFGGPGPGGFVSRFMWALWRSLTPSA